MQAFRYTLINGELYYDEKGEVLVVVDNNLISVMSGGKEIENPMFHLSREERVLLDRLKLMAEKTGLQVNPLWALAYPGKLRSLMLSKIMGSLFEDFVYEILSKHFVVERHVKTFESLSKFTGERYHNTPDLIVEGKIAVEAKVSYYGFQQLLEYSKRFPMGALVLPFSSQCRVPHGWRHFSNFLADQKPLISWIEGTLHG
ncbi:hypothetical protein [Metallosphaera hakonensis]|uniref:Uncharacterized protein n=1 Tax=Metallosphaera hakonensis JCM 8857 = DSM 7519 TaxID=1293036 RepID=A0A2U9ISY1_9CREN|nr:hypothetical protein [Metallosphaera hakonensis]AWR99136.1 hypothetical protein DFR87_04845 [Metallosphaera hakonensis JCM 8857 = DSM 7519]